MSNGLTYAFGKLLSDIGPWFLLGVAISGMISALIPANAIENYLGDGFFSMTAMLFLSIPLYVCATASTPIAAALALKGLSPGAAVVFLLAGPATNAASITVISKMLGKRATVIYLGAIAVVSLTVGIFTNEIYQWIGIDITSWVSRGTEAENSLLSALPAVVLAGIIAVNLVRKKREQGKAGKTASSCC